MASVPVDIVRIGDVAVANVSKAILAANSAQSSFVFSELSEDSAARFAAHSYRSVRASQMLDALEEVRQELRGYHPFLIALTDAQIDGKNFGNLFGSHRAENGLAIVTTSNVASIILPDDRLHPYFVYYFARYGLSFVAPAHRNHDDCRECVFDRKIDKRDLIKSMKRRPLCDECRAQLLSAATQMSPRQLDAVERLFAASGDLLRAEAREVKPRVFIGSSSEGLSIANKVKELLAPDHSVVVWNQGTVFGLGDATLEALERAVLEYDFGVFVFTPDDELHMRGVQKPVARDNVVFELGLFIGRLGRGNAYVVQPGRGSIALPTDLSGITTATYDPREMNLSARLGPAVSRIRDAIARQWSRRV